MKLPNHMRLSFQNEQYEFEESIFQKFSHSSFTFIVPFTNKSIGENGKLCITKLDKEIYCYIESNQKENQYLLTCLESVKEFILSKENFQKKMNQDKLSVQMLTKPVDFKKIQRKRKLLSYMKTIFIFLMIFFSFFLVTSISIHAESTIQSLRIYITSIFFLISGYLLYRSSQMRNRTHHKQTFRLFVITMICSLCSLLSFIL